MNASKSYTRGPWKVMTHHYSTGAIEREICTEWEHGQLKGPVPVVGLAVDANGPLVSISKEDAELIASAPTLLYRIQQLEKENAELRQQLERYSQKTPQE